MFSITKTVTLALLCLAGCLTDVVEPTDVVDPADLAGIAEQYCKNDLTLPCGKVYQFNEQPHDNPLGLLELCVPWLLDPAGFRPTLEQAVAELGPAMLSTDPRFAGGNLCWWQCPSMRGCNAYNSCYCPEAEIP